MDTVPLFPLPDHVLLPGVAMPYRLFEPRYRALAQHLDEQPPHAQLLALPRLLPGNEPPPFATVAALAAVQRLEEQADGTWLLLVTGGARVRLQEIASDAPFRRAAHLLLPDVDEDARDLAPLTAGVRDLAQRFRAQLGERGALLDPVLSDAGPVGLPDRLAALLIGSPDERQAFLEERRASTRAQRIQRVLARLTGSRGEPSLN